MHEHVLLSDECPTPLRPGILFTREPSIFLLGRVGVRVGAVFLLTEAGAEPINTHHYDMLATGR